MCNLLNEITDKMVIKLNKTDQYKIIEIRLTCISFSFIYESIQKFLKN